MIVCAGDIESFDFANSVGIGLIDPAIHLTKFLLSMNPKEILFVGTAGSYGNYQIFDFVETSNATQIESSCMKNQSYSPIEFKIVSCETMPIVNSSNYITTDAEIAKRYLELGIELENMEFFSILSVAKSFGIKARGLFVITNYTDKNAHRDFIKNHQKAKEILIDAVKGKK